MGVKGGDSLDTFVARHVAPLFVEAGFRRRGRIFTKERLPLRASAHVVRFRSGTYFNVRLGIAMPLYSDWAALAFADASSLAKGQGHLQEWQWPLVLPEADVAASLKEAIVRFALPWCEQRLSLESLKETLQRERETLNRARYLSLVNEQLGEFPEALFWWIEFCKPERPETAAGTLARARFDYLTAKAKLEDGKFGRR